VSVTFTAQHQALRASSPQRDHHSGDHLATGVASANFTANATAGSYNVSAAAASLTTVNFSLTNTPDRPPTSRSRRRFGDGGNRVQLYGNRLDASNNTATGYTGTAHFTSSDGAAVLPANYAFVAGDNGAHVFSDAEDGRHPDTDATDTVTGSITGTSGPIAVTAGAATHFTVSAPGSATAEPLSTSR